MENRDERNRRICNELSGIDEELIFRIDKEILSRSRDRGVLENIDDILGMPDDDPAAGIGKGWCNTYPFGTPTNEVFPGFVAVCRGSTSLKSVLDVIEKQSQKMAVVFGKHYTREKTVVLITDKWEDRTFRAYEKKMLMHAMNDGIWTILLLATDYGCTEIPFLPHDRGALDPYTGSVRRVATGRV